MNSTQLMPITSERTETNIRNCFTDNRNCVQPCRTILVIPLGQDGVVHLCHHRNSESGICTVAPALTKLLCPHLLVRPVQTSIPAIRKTRLQPGHETCPHRVKIASALFEYTNFHRNRHDVKQPWPTTRRISGDYRNGVTSLGP